MATACVNNLVNKRGKKIVFGINLVQIPKINTDINSFLFFLFTGIGLETHDMYIIGQFNKHGGVYLFFSVMSRKLARWRGHCFYEIRDALGHVLIQCSTMKGYSLGIFE